MPSFVPTSYPSCPPAERPPPGPGHYLEGLVALLEDAPPLEDDVAAWLEQHQQRRRELAEECHRMDRETSDTSAAGGRTRPTEGDAPVVDHRGTT